MYYDDYTQDSMFYYYEHLISEHLSRNNKLIAQQIAFEWLTEYQNSLNIIIPWNWKIAKKQICSYYFGKIPSLCLYYNDDFKKGYDFIATHSTETVRCSYYKSDAACHSESKRIDSFTISWLNELRCSMSLNDVVILFLENSSDNSICFRRFSLAYDEEIAYEVGFGQAMYVFEAERGFHEVASCRKNTGNWIYEECTNTALREKLYNLIQFHEHYLSMKSRCICYHLGIPQISIEGYFDFSSPTKLPDIVDIDLPFDRAFF